MATSILAKNFPGVDLLQQKVNEAEYIIGLDLHKKTTAICIIQRSQPHVPIFQRKRLDNNRLLETLNNFPGQKVCICEAAFGWHTLSVALQSRTDIKLIALNAYKTAAWTASMGIKNDKVDAQVLCHVCLQNGIPRLAVYEPTQENHECMKLTMYRQSIIRQRTRLKNQLKAIAQACIPNPYSGEIPVLSATVQLLKYDIETEIQHVQERLQLIEQHIQALTEPDTIVSLLQTIPGIGPVTAFALRHKIGDIERFTSAAHLTSYIGLAIREYSSGGTSTKGRITKTGNMLLRSLLIQGAQVVRSLQPQIATLFCPKLMVSDKHVNKVTVALARKATTFVYYVWKNKAEFSIELYKEKRALQQSKQPDSSFTPSSKTVDLGVILA